jgi:endonuclease YncB( thermonuclease family)
MRRDIWLAGAAGAIVGSWLTLVAIQVSERGFHLPHRGNGTTTAENRPAATAPSETAKAGTMPPKAIEAPKPAETTKQSDANSGQPQSEGQPLAQAGGSATQATKEKATILATASPSTSSSDGGPELSAAAMAAAAAASDDDETKVEESKTAAAEPVTQQHNKVPTDPARSNDVSTKLEEAQASPPATDAAKDKDAAPSRVSQPSESAPDKAAAASSETASSDEVKTDPVPDNRIPADQIDRETAAAEHRTLPPESPQQQPQPEPQPEQTALDPASKPQEQMTTIELVRPFSDQAGILTITGRSVQLSGIVPTDVGRMCTGPSGKDWPCGQAARTAFRMYLRGRSIDCDVPDANWKGTVKGACRYVRVDLSAWLVRFGWADPEPGSPLASLVDEARQKKRGMYGDDPRKNGKSTLGPALPKEDPLNPI